MHKKQEALVELLKSYKKVAVAFSSGVDSTYLLKVAKDTLGDNVIAITASSRSFPGRELEEAKAFCTENGIEHYVVETDELNIEGYKDNPKNRCYLCKNELFKKIIKVAEEHGIDIVAEASNTDDNGDYRPGMIAIKELGVKSPLRAVEMSKAEIRALSKEHGLSTWRKQSFACLSTRFVYGEPITEEKLEMVDKAEQLLMDMGFGQLRVRIHDKLARIEVTQEEFDKIMEPEARTKIHEAFKSYGFSYVTLDLLGYRTGSMNETLTKEELQGGMNIQ